MADIYPRKRYTTRRAPARKTYVRRTTYSRRIPQIPRGYPRGITRTELKSCDTTLSTASNRCDTTGDVTLISGIARGDDINERTGRKVTLKSIELHLYAKVTAGTGVDQTQRFLVVYDKQANATALTITDVLVSASTMALQNLDNRNRFRILYDQVFHLNATAESDSAKTLVLKKAINLPMTFNSGDAGTIADITTGSVYFLCMGSEARGNTAGDMQGRVRIRYADM